MKRKILWLVIGATIIVIGAAAITAVSLITAKVPSGENEVGRLIYIDRDDTADSVRTKSAIGWRWSVYTKVFSFHPRTGRYRVMPGMSYLQLYRMLRNGTQEPMNLVVPTSRTMERLAAALSQSLMVDSAEIATALTDSFYCATHGYTTATIPALFIPNTYEVYWDISVDKFMERMERENNRFWTAERKA